MLIIIAALCCALGFLFGVYLTTGMLALVSIASFAVVWMMLKSAPNEGLAVLIRIAFWIIFTVSNLTMWITAYHTHNQSWVGDFIRTYVLR